MATLYFFFAGEGLEDFQEFIVHRFGFISLRDLQADAEHRTYVHTTGGMFVMMPRTLSLADAAVSPDTLAEPVGERPPFFGARTIGRSRLVWRTFQLPAKFDELDCIGLSRLSPLYIG